MEQYNERIMRSRIRGERTSYVNYVANGYTILAILFLLLLLII